MLSIPNIRTNIIIDVIIQTILACIAAEPLVNPNVAVTLHVVVQNLAGKQLELDLLTDGAGNGRGVKDSESTTKI